MDSQHEDKGQTTSTPDQTVVEKGGEKITTVRHPDVENYGSFIDWLRKPPPLEVATGLPWPFGC